jgi:hypothetical protein
LAILASISLSSSGGSVSSVARIVNRTICNGSVSQPPLSNHSNNHSAPAQTDLPASHN